MENPPVQPTFDIDGNRMTMLDTGPRRLDALIALIDGAAHSLRMIYYIYVDDEAGARVRQALIDAQLRGVAVALIVDGMGSESAQNHGFFAPMRDAGIDVCRFVPRWGRRYLLRNHQKLVLADECRAIIGGFNVEDSYFGTPADQAWRDLGTLRQFFGGSACTALFDLPWTPIFLLAMTLVHPLLGAHVRLPEEPERHAWQADVGTETQPWLGDHQVHNVAALPGAAYVEMALAAARTVLGDAVFDSAYAEGSALSVERAAAVARLLKAEA